VAGSADQEPWADLGTVNPQEQLELRRKYIEERYRLMPYLYTLAEETARTGVPMRRPVFMEFPNGARDGHPIDIDAQASGEFMLGHNLLIAPAPYPEQPDAYMAELPTRTWYDYWNGKRLPQSPPAKPGVDGIPLSGPDLVPLTATIHPVLSTLPVFVRGGAILPVAPLTQSTAEVPQGPLTLRVYAGPDCRGSLYLDDGHSYAYTRGESRRMDFTCEVTPEALTLKVAEQGSYKPWWTQVRVEIYGWEPHAGSAAIEGDSGSGAAPAVRREGEATVVMFPETGKGLTLRVQ
jgi:alpha-glucosidase